MTEKVTKQQIAEWKEKYTQVVVAKADEHTAYFRKPTRQELSYAMTLQQSGKNLEMQEHILKSCHLGGSKIFYQNADYMLGAAGVVEQLVKVKQVEVKNL